MNWLMLGGMAAITFWNRYAFFAKALHYRPGPKMQRLLGYSSFAILTAIWAPILFRVDYESSSMSVAGWDYIIAGAVAAVMTVLRVPSIVVVLLSTGLFFIIRLFVGQ
ncbi:AzlD domain-containing protein [Arenicella xantha]|uniref:Branched-subunit amino acid transport protein n=1 Tax=Arenicella xantha TaxID=644221 RepID=A0A395JF44_9GAMM|nr:AzlD domain-containing protein [Arenicella xantha]RBP48345.1 branched-subunit amino acid transport protein [Arenicella xantha]